MRLCCVSCDSAAYPSHNAQRARIAHMQGRDAWPTKFSSGSLHILSRTDSCSAETSSNDETRQSRLYALRRSFSNTSRSALDGVGVSRLPVSAIIKVHGMWDPAPSRLSLSRYHNSSGVALYHHVGTAKEYHWICMSLQKHRMIHASTSRRPHDQLCTYSQRTRQVARALLSSLELDARVMARRTHTASIPQSDTRDHFGAQHASASGSWEAWQPQPCSHGVNGFTLMASDYD
jgi:hypothetical protein